MPPIGDDHGVYNLDKKPKSVQGSNPDSGWHNGWHARDWPQPDTQTRQILLDHYGIPEWVFKNIGWNANGFFASSIQESGSESQGAKAYTYRKFARSSVESPGDGLVDSYARFLSKEVEVSENNVVDYDWTFMSFVLISKTTSEPHYESNMVQIWLGQANCVASGN